MADDTPKTDVLAALTDFAGRADLTPEAREDLEILLARWVDGFEIAPTKALALTPAALAKLIGRSEASLSGWREKHLGPPAIAVRFGSQTRWLYPVAGLRKWLEEWEFEGSYYPDPKILAAFGLTRREPEQVAA